MNKDGKISATRLRNALDEAGLKPIELAELSGVHRATISHYLKGTYVPTNINAIKMASVLGVDPAWLMGLPTKNINSANSDAAFMVKVNRLDQEDRDTVETLVDTLLSKSKYKKIIGNEGTGS